MLKYEQIRVLGQGGFGKAILARKKYGQEKIVIKEVQLFSLKPRDREISFQEAKLLSTLNYPFIISYLESFQERGNLYIVMEYADGGDLSQKVEKLREKRSSANSEIFNLFRSNKKILLFFIKERFLNFDEYMARKITTEKYVKKCYQKFFFPENIIKIMMLGLKK